MDKVLITGGAGYIGSMVNKMVADAGYDTVVLDNLSRGDASTIVRGKFVEGDVGDRELLDNLFETNQFSAVLHFAAFIDVGESVRLPGKYYANNVSKTLTLLEKMKQHGVDNFIFSSSAGVYGSPEKLPISEDHPTKPINPYGRTKLIIEEALGDFGFNYVCLRYFNAAGGDPDREIKIGKLHETNLIPILFRSLHKSNKSFTINGDDYETRDGTCLRDYIHIYDLGMAHIQAMEYLLAGGASAVFNLGNGHGFTVKEIVATVEMVTGQNFNVTIGPRRAGDPPALVANAAKAKSVLKWKPKHPDLAHIVRDAWQVYSVDKIAKKV